MSLHRNAKLGLGGRLALVGAIEGGLSIRAAACRFNASPATAHRWWRRWGEADEEMRRTLSCLDDRSSRPHRSPRELASVLQERICACRRETGWDRGSSPARPALPTRPCGRCFTEPGSRGRREPNASPPTATSGLAPAISCTWTCRSTCVQTTRSPSDGRSALPRQHPRRRRSRACDRRRPTPGSPTARSLSLIHI